jgi:leader peptidase (prepilin peptidase) / N-methyltransferase
VHAAAIVASIPIGLVVGSVLTMVIDRVPDDLRVLGRPRCPLCEHDLAAVELIPLASWLRQRGRCTHCHERLTVAYPLVEIVTAASFALATARFHTWWVVVPFWLFFAMLVTVSTVDMFRYRIPDRVVFPTLLVGLLAIVVVSQHFDLPSAITRAVIGAVLFAGVLLLLAIMPGGGMGLGDVKLALVLGLFLGWLAVDISGVVVLVFVALMIGSMLGAVMGLVVGYVRVKTQREILPDPDLDEGEMLRLPWTKQPFPFGPSLALATVVAVMLSNQLT